MTFKNIEIILNCLKNLSCCTRIITVPIIHNFMKIDLAILNT